VRNNHTAGKRSREADRNQRKQDKNERLRRSRENSGGGIPIASVADIQVAAMATPMPDVFAEAPEAAAPRSSGPPCRLFVGSLAYETVTADLATLFGTIGHVLDAVVLVDRDTGESRRFGFVTMDRKSAARAVKELDGHSLHGYPIRVNVATDRSR